MSPTAGIQAVLKVMPQEAQVGIRATQNLLVLMIGVPCLIRLQPQTLAVLMNSS